MLALMSTLAFTDTGQGEPCLFVHAFPFDGRMWDAQRDALAPSHRVIVPDLRGFGRSASLPPARSAFEHADDLAELLDRLNLRRATVIGLSMGGYIAFAMMRRHPDRIGALVLADTRALPDSAEAKENRDVNIELVRREGAKVLMEKLRPALLAEDASEEAVAKALSIGSSQSTEGIANALMALRDRPDSRDLLPSIHVPTAVIVGEHDTLSPVTEMKEMADAIPNASFTVIPSAGHLANLEKPEDFNAALKAAVG